MKGKSDYVILGLFLLALLAFCSALWNWYNPKPEPSRAFLPAAPMPQAAGIPKIDKPAPPTIKVIPKLALSKKVDLPAEILEDPDVEVTATGIAPPSEGGSSIITTIDERGETKILVKGNPLPLFGFPSDVELMARAGITSRGTQAVDLALRYQFLRVGKVKVGAYLEGSADLGGDRSRVDGKAMIEATMKIN